MSASSYYDDFRLRQSEAGPEVPDFDVQCRTVIDINDNNQGNYSGGQITFDLNQLVSSDDYLDWGSTYLTIPVQMTAQALTGGTGGNSYSAIQSSLSNAFAMCLKGSNLALINSINVTCNNQQLIGNTQLSNIPLNWKVVSAFNHNDVDVLGSFFNFQKDSARGFYLDPVSGECNNNPSPNIPCFRIPGATPTGTAAGAQIYPQGYIQDIPLTNEKLGQFAGINTNEGMYNRCRKQAYAYEDVNISQFMQMSALVTERAGIVYTNPANAINPQTAAQTTITFQTYAQIPMKYLHDLFHQMPLVRAALWQMVITTHLPSTFSANLVTQYHTNSTTTPAIAAAVAGASLQWVPTNAANQNGFTPFLVSMAGVPFTATAPGDGTMGVPAVDNQGLSVTAGAAGTVAAPTVFASCPFLFTAQIGFGTVGGNSLGNVCTMHCVTYKLSPAMSERYMREPRKRVVFQDFLRATPAALTNIPPNQFIQANISPGTSKVRGLLMCPYLPVVSGAAPLANGSNAVVSALTSALTPCGATVTPYFFLDNFNVMISGRPIWPKNILYRYDYFIREIFGINTGNGNGVEGMRAGLIDEDDFNAGYGFIYVNLERHLASADDLPVSVDVNFQNKSLNTMSFNSYLFYEKDFNLDCVSGKILA